MTRDPVAELYAARAAGRHRSTLLVPVQVPYTRQTTYWLTLSQYLTLAWLRRRMRHHRGETTLERMAEQLGTTPGALVHRLDRLAQLSLIGRHSTRGRHGRTRFWPPRRARVALEAGRRAGRTGNVVTSTPFGGYLSREGLSRALRGSTGPPLTRSPAGGPPPAAGGGRSRSDRRARRPPRLLYGRCPLDGARVRLSRRELQVTDWRHHGGPRRIRGLYGGRCARCRALSIAPLDVGIPRPEALRPRGPGDAPPLVVNRTPERARAAAEILDSGLVAEPEVRERLRALWAPDRPREYDALAAARDAGLPPLPRRELPVLVASDPADTPALVDLADRWLRGDVDLEVLEAAGYGPGRAWWDLSAAAGRGYHPRPGDGRPGEPRGRGVNPGRGHRRAGGPAPN